MKESTYDPCLLYTHKDRFGIVSLQTDNTLFLGDQMFAKAEETELKKAKFLTKEHEQLTIENLIKFNSGQIKLSNNSIIELTQTHQCQNLKLVALKEVNITNSKGKLRQAVIPKDQYVA